MASTRSAALLLSASMCACSLASSVTGAPLGERNGPVLAQPQECPQFAPGVVRAKVSCAELMESSGIALSRANRDVVWTHNDSGDAPRLLAIGLNGQYLGEVTLVGVTAVDFEDVAIGPGPEPGQPYLYVGDIGDNLKERGSAVIYRFAEPKLPSPPGDPVRQTVEVFSTLELRYSSGPLDAETLMVDPVHGDVYVVSKEYSGRNEVLRIAAPPQGDGVYTAEPVATINVGLTTGGDFSPAGDEIVIKTYDDAFLWKRPAGASVATTLRGPACRIPLQSELQGEAIGFAVDGSGYYTLGEGRSQPLHFFQRR